MYKRQPLNDNCGLQFSGGPYIALGIGGKSKLNWVLATNERYDDEDVYKRQPLNIHKFSLDKKG